MLLHLVQFHQIAFGQFLFTWNLGPMIKPFGYFFTLNRLLDSLFVDHRIQKREHAPVDSIKSNWFSIS